MAADDRIALLRRYYEERMSNPSDAQAAAARVEQVRAFAEARLATGASINASAADDGPVRRARAALQEWGEGLVR